MAGITISSGVPILKSVANQFGLEQILYPTKNDGKYYRFADEDGLAITELADTVLVGSPFYNIPIGSGNRNIGTMDIYQKNPSSGGYSVTNRDALEYDDSDSTLYGASVAVKGNLMVVGAWQLNNEGKKSSGAAYVFELNPVTNRWNHTRKLAPSVNEIPNYAFDHDYFGASVEILNNDEIIIGAPNAQILSHDNNYKHQQYRYQIQIGVVYVFRRSGGGWVQTQRLSRKYINSNYGGFDFGACVVTNGDYLMVGAPGFWMSSGSSYPTFGGVYVFKKENDTWVEKQFIRGKGESYGKTIAIHNNTMAVGMPESESPVYMAGEVQVFELENSAWVLKQTLSNTNPVIPMLNTESTRSYKFGCSLGLNQNFIVVGSSGASITRRGSYGGSTLLGSGLVHVYKKINDVWGLEQTIVPSPYSVGSKFGSTMSLVGNYLAVGATSYVDAKRNTRGFVAVYKFISEEDVVLPPVTWDLVSTADEIGEDRTIEITLISNYAWSEMVVPYVISGVSQEDIDIPLSGVFIINNVKSATIQIKIIGDEIREFTEYLTITCDSLELSKTITIINTTPAPVYALATDAQTVNEGDSFTITLSSINTDEGDVVPYIITGVTSGDIDNTPLAGSFIVGAKPSITFTTSEDITTEGDETFTLTIMNTTVSISVTILDTSKAPVYTLSSSETAVDEGEEFTVTLTAENVSEGSSLPYAISGVTVNDISGELLSGNFILNGGTASKTFLVAADNLKENTETFKLSILSGSKFVNVTIYDTSYPAVYSLTSDPATSVNEGATLTINLVATPNVPAGTVLPYEITGVSSEDLNNAPLTGDFVVGSVQSIQFVLTEDVATEGNEIFKIGLTGFPTVTKSVTIIDSSQPPTYTLRSSHVTINEGQKLTITLVTQFVPNGTTFDYEISGVDSADISNESLTGTLTISNNAAYKEFTIANDFTSDGAEVLTFTIPSVNASISVAIKDTSIPVYTLTRNSVSVNEGQPITITLATQGVPQGTIVPFIITGISSADLNGASLTGSFTVGTVNSVTYTVSADITTEGVETFNLRLEGRTENISVTINDTSQPPVYTLSASASSVNEGSSITITLSTQFVTSGTEFPYTITGIAAEDVVNTPLTGKFVVGTTNSIVVQLSNDMITEGVETFTVTLDQYPLINVTVTVNDTSQPPVFNLSSNIFSVKEGKFLSIILNTQYVPNGTLVPYTITGVSSLDINNASLTGNFVVFNNTSSILLTITEDFVDESNETLVLRLDNGQGSVSVLIKDTFPLTPLNADIELLITGEPSSNLDTSGGADSITLTTIIELFGNASTGSFTPFSLDEGKWSVYFDGNGDYLTLPAGSESTMSFGSGDFTIEAWIYLTVNTSSTIFCNRCWFTVSATSITLTQTGIVQILTATIPSILNTWVHVAATRSGTTFRLFVNGVLQNSTTASITFDNISTRIGIETGSLIQPFNGYISNLRAVKGTALYTSNFTPSTTASTPVTGTTLLACQSNRFIDNSANKFSLTVSGNSTISPKSPYSNLSYDSTVMGGSIMLDGTGDYLAIADGATTFRFGSDEFTIEMWLYLRAKAAGTQFFNTGDGTGTTFVIGLNNTPVFEFYTAGASRVVGTTNPTLFTWYHLAVSRRAGVTRLFVNGVQEGVSYTDTNVYTCNTGYPLIGSRPSQTTVVNGFISNVLATKGLSLYNANFVPPTSVQPITLNTILHIAGNDAGVNDSSSKTNIEMVGEVGLSDVKVQNNDYSVYFDGVSDRLILPASERWHLGSTYTVETWVNLDTLPVGATCRLIMIGANASNTAWCLEISTLGAVRALIPLSTVTNYIVTTPDNVITANNWYHIAVSVQNGTCRIFVDGVQRVSGTLATQVFSGTNLMYIGYDTVATVNAQYKGYIDDLRITKRALYTTNFTPPGNKVSVVASTQTAYEGDTITFTITPSGYANETNIPYAITGITQDDLSAGQLSGFFIVGSKETISITLAMDLAVEGNETITLSIPQKDSTATVTVIDSSQPPVYELITLPPSLVFEGRDLSVILSTKFVPVNTSFNYTITGVTSDDINGLNLNGSMITSGTPLSGTATLSIPISADNNLESPESITVSIPSLSLSKTVNILDTSIGISMNGNTVLYLSAEDPVRTTYFVDSSKNSYPLTVTNSVPSTFTPISRIGYSSAYFDGAGDYVSSTNASITTGEFTIEFWIYPATTSGNRVIIDNGYWQTGNNGGYVVHLYTGNTIGLSASNGVWNTFPSLLITTSTIPSVGWSHVAITRNASNQINIYINGVSAATTLSYSASLNQGGGQSLKIGGRIMDGTLYEAFTGYISNLRIVAGTCVYSSNFTPPTQPLTAIANTILLTFNNPSIADQSTVNRTLTLNGNVTRHSMSPFTYVDRGIGVNGTSIFTETTGSVATTSNITPETSYTSEFWVYVTAQTGNHQSLFGMPGWHWRFGSGQYGTMFQCTINGAWWTSALNISYFHLKWRHVACVKTSTGRYYLYVDGVRINMVGGPDPGTYSAEYGTSGTAPAASQVYWGSSYSYTYNARFLNGVELYTANFTPSMSLLQPTIQNSVLIDSIPVISNEANAGALIPKNGLVPSTTVSRNGNYSLFFNGTSHFAEVRDIMIPGEPLRELTIEAWVYPTVLNKGSCIISEIYTGAGDSVSFALGIGTEGGTTDSNLWVGSYSGSAWVTAKSTTVLTLNQWTHVAGVYLNGIWTLYVNGTLVATASTSISVSMDSENVLIGRRWDTSTSPYFAGYMDNVMITKRALYTGVFTPPGIPYAITASANSINEGESVTFTVTANNVSNGTVVPYTITGVTSADINGASLTGTFTVGSNMTLTVVTSSDRTTEGNETLTLTLDGKSVSAAVTIVDISINPVYALSASSTTVNEGGSVTITLTITNALDETTVPYTITGVSTSDIVGGSLTGNFTMGATVNGVKTGNVTIALVNDLTLEGSETLTLTINNTQTSIQITVADTSKPSYSLTSDVTSANEGTTFIVTLNTINVQPQTQIPYTVTGISATDLVSGVLTGNFTVNGTIESGSASVSFSLVNDKLQEGSETFTITLDNNQATLNVTINDTSTPSYVLTSSATNVNEGGQITITLQTEGVPTGTLVPYTITGATSADINNASLTGNITVNQGSILSGSGSFTLTITADNISEGPETVTVSLNNGKAFVSFTINDTSLGPTYALTASASSINEGQSVTYTLTTTNVANGTNVPYSISGAIYGELDNYRTLTGNFNVNNGTATLTLTPLIDQMGYGNKNMTVTITGAGVSATVQVLQVVSTPGYKFTQTSSTAASGTGGVPTGVTADGANIWCSGGQFSSGWVGTTFTAIGSNTNIKYAVDDYADVYINGLKYYGQYGGVWYSATFPTTSGQTYYVSVYLRDTGGDRGFKMSIRNGVSEAGTLIKNTSTSGWVRT